MINAIFWSTLATTTLLRQGYRPERTILFGLGHDEETGGTHGAKVMGELLKERGVRLAGIVDEGGGISDGLAAGVRGAVGLIGASEKGYLTVEFTVRGQPGHSSTPPPQTAIGILARALSRLESRPMSTRMRRLRPLYHGIGRAAQTVSTSSPSVMIFFASPHSSWIKVSGGWSTALTSASPWRAWPLWLRFMPNSCKCGAQKK
ncbi:MAG: M20/M25/M40 family metallo-hydrolase [Chloroflexi bacterium]|nr:M20/M25/M40 family metallo-hydrolase [Ardenticatenaceae bacterium]MBL1127958.1 M20/M25/M40 family metallo-hydrolase [Chloroflexota bacterium]NOG34030.1 M20/M25/M40 family metallo-hydrolase [Chloroflexota bacterium]GIK54446.1 MAG: hypothetical protein BroJett015_01090 [Chloroflexota bacterium]